jgi:hypothetical protein
MLLSHLENKAQTKPRRFEDSVTDPVKPPASTENDTQKFGKYRLVCGGLIFMGLTVGIFWYQFSEIPVGQRPPIWSQLQWRYLASDLESAAMALFVLVVDLSSRRNICGRFADLGDQPRNAARRKFMDLLKG